MEHWRQGGRPTSAEGVFATLTQVASSFSDAPPVNDRQQIGGPLYGQMLLSQMGVVAEGGRGRCVYSGIGRVDFLPAVSRFEL